MSPRLRKWLKVSLALGAAGGIGVATLTVVVTRPGVQRGLALEALKRAGWTGDIRALEVGFSGNLSLEGADLTGPTGRRVKCERAMGSVGWGGFFFGIPHVSRLEAEGVELSAAGIVEDGSGPTGSGESSPDFEVPHWRVDAASISGRVVSSTGRAWRGRIRLSDYESAKGGRASFDIADECVDGVRLTGDGRVKLSGERAGGDWRSVWRGLRPSLDAEFEVRPVRAESATVKCSIKGEADGLQFRAVTAGGEATLRADIPERGDAVVSGEWRLRRESFAAWLPAGSPTGDLQGRISAIMTPESGKWSAKGAFAAAATEVPSGYDGPVSASGDAELEGDLSGHLGIRKLNAVVSASGATGVRLSVSGLTLGGGAGVSGATGSLSVRGVPAAWVNPWFAGSGWGVPAGVLSGELDLKGASDGAVEFASREAFRLVDARVTGPGGVAVSGVSVMFPVSGNFKQGGVATVRLAGGTVALAGKDAVKLDASLSLKGGGMSSDFKGNVVPFVAFSPFSRGGENPGFPESLRLEFSGRVQKDGGGWRVDAGEVLAKNGADTLLTVGLSSPVATERSESAWPEARVSFQGAPLSLLAPFCAGGEPGGVVREGDLTFSKSARGWSLRRLSGGHPVRIEGLSWKGADGRDRLLPCELRVSPEVKSDGADWSVSLDGFSLGRSGSAAVKGHCSVGWRDGVRSADADLAADLSALAMIAPGGLFPGSGSVLLTGRYGDAGENRLVLKAEGMTPPGGGPARSLSAELTERREGASRRLLMPVVLSGPSGTSRGEFSADATLASDAWRWDARFLLGELWCDDWLALVPGGRPAEASPTSGRNPVADARDRVAAWTGHAGVFSVEAEVVHVAGEHVRRPRFTLHGDPTALRIPAFSAEWRGLPVRGEASLEFRSDEALPYGLMGKVGVDRVPLGRVIAAFAPNSAGWIEGDFHADAAVSAHASRLGGLAGTARTRLTLSGHDGALRVFKADNEAVRMAGEIADIAGDLAGDLGALIGRHDRHAAGMLDAATRVKRALSDLRYDSCDLKVDRMPDGVLELRTFELISPESRWRAEGRLGAPISGGFLSRSVRLNGTLDAKGALARALIELGRASPEAGAGGWYAGPALRYEGALDNFRNDLLTNVFKAVSQPERTAR